jgi:uncharacterized protein YdaU (DUF1376 family)
MHYYKFDINLYRASTAQLTHIENLCFRVLLDEQYLTEKPIPKEIKKLARRLNLSAYEAEIMQVLNEFFCETELGWSNKMVEKQLIDYKKRKFSSSLGGKNTQAAKKAFKEIKNNDLEF